MQGYCDVYKWTILKRTSPEVKCLHLTSSRREMCTPSISNVIYHKFSHGAAFYTLNGKNVNVMLESYFMYLCPCNHLLDRQLVRIFHLLLLEKCLPHLGPLTSLYQTSVMAELTFCPSSDKLEMPTSSGHGRFL